MCGATGAQVQLEQKEADFYTNAIDMSKTTFAEQQALYQQLSSEYAPILAGGPNQMGYSQDELNTLNAQAVNGTAQNYNQAAKAVNESLAAEGGGNSPLTNGAQTQLKAETAASAASQESSEETQILESGYQQGYTEFTNATGALEAVAAGYNPTGFESGANSAGSAAGTTANQIAQENNSWVNAAIGAAGSLGSAVVNENPGGIFGG